jgi:hypothetical protein
MRRALLSLFTLLLAVAAAIAVQSGAPRSAPEAPLAVGSELEHLRAEFNRRADRPRLLAVLSPACPVCLAGAQAIRRELLERDAGIEVILVWSEVLPFDRDSKVARRVDLFAGRPDVVSFVDPDARLPRALAPVLGWPAGEQVWDAYLFYPAGARWEEEPPHPESHVHQQASIDDGRYRTGDSLRQALRNPWRSPAPPTGEGATPTSNP